MPVVDMERCLTGRLLVPVLLVFHHHHVLLEAAMDSCYDAEGTPSRCMPRFENIAFNRTVVASNVCGSPREDYCMQTSSARLCHICDLSEPDFSHNSSFLTDFHMDSEPTWWQSQSMYYGIQHPNSVNLSLHLGKAFEITYIRLKFYTSRPESFAIFKRTEEGGPWLPYQYYSASCKKTYGTDAGGYIQRGQEERSALCSKEFSDISPLTGGNVAFSTLEGRPSAYNFDQSFVLQDWVTATDLLISLDRLNTFGDEFFKDAKVLRSYFYAVSDFSVGGWCKCNGHASECVEDEHGRLACVCQHHTVGVDCQQCHPFYQDRPWARATGESANECLKCNCSGRSEQCVFDTEQYRSTGSGGRCLSCRNNTEGPHCERCKENNFRVSPDEACLPCDCNINGSISLQCDVRGRCPCRDGVMEEKCDTCRAGFHSLGPTGCRTCDCDPSGSVHACSPVDGHCYCKAHVEGHICNRCKPGFYNLQQVNPQGCQPCFCFGHSLACSSSSHHTALNITSDFFEDQDGWLGEFSGGQEYPLLWKEGDVYLLPLTEEDIGFYKAPEKFLGNQIFSYGQILAFTFTSEISELLPNIVTLRFQGSGMTLSADLSPQASFGHDPSLPARNFFTIRLHESETRFSPSLSAFEFHHLLSNLTTITISNAGGVNYTSQLSGVTLASASTASGAGSSPAPWVESCSCPVGLAGRLCERCAPGFTRDIPSGGPFSTCVPCNCHHHGRCHPETGVCECSHFTTGMTCQRCLPGYYGNALIGTPADCQPCPCPDRSSCAQIAETGQVVCTNCPPGQTGMRCQVCEDGYFGDPLGQSGVMRPCMRCDCNGNVDHNAVGICDGISGRCLKCLGHTEGDRCQRCQQGFYGNALDQTAGNKCKPCSCNRAGSSVHVSECHPQTGSCSCLGHVTGRDCSHCQVGFFNLQAGIGCQRCQCNPVGASSTACHPVTGQCVCRSGVEGRLCDSCRLGFFGFSSRGCRACNCDPMGSVSMQCHANGTCQCRRGFVGYKCDKCELNYFHNRVSHQCEECPLCYSLVRKQAEKLSTRLQDLEKILARFNCRGRFGQQRHLQGEDTLPNALEDFLAFQEAREALIKQFSLLEASAHTLLSRLHGVTSALNCSISVSEDEGKSDGRRGACPTFTRSLLGIREAQKQLQQATRDLDNMVIPFEAPGPNKWNLLVNESQVLLKSHRETAEHMEVEALRAKNISKLTFSFLMDLLEDKSTEDNIKDLSVRLSHIKRHQLNLMAEVGGTADEQLALGETAAGLSATLRSITSSLPTLAQSDANQSVSEQTQLTRRTSERIADLKNRTQELHIYIHGTSDVITKIAEKAEPVIETAHKNLGVAAEIIELKPRIEAAKLVALRSVVTSKEAESQTTSLHRHFDLMVREWPRLQTQTKAAVRKRRPLEDRILDDVRKKLKILEDQLKPAMESSSLFINKSREAKHAAHAVAKESKAVLTQAKHTRTASSQLGSLFNSTLLRLDKQEERFDTLNSHVTAEPPPSLSNVKEDIEAAKHQLQAYSLTLTELISKIDGNVPLERFDRILNETARRLNMLRGSVESSTLSGKIQTLHLAAKDQQSQLSIIEQDIQEIRDERDSLRDIALNLPQSCPRATGAGNH